MRVDYVETVLTDVPHNVIPNFDTVGATSLHTTVEDLQRWDENFYHPCVGGSEEKIRISAVVPRNRPLRRGALGQTRSTNLSTLLRKSCAAPAANSLH